MPTAEGAPSRKELLMPVRRAVAMLLLGSALAAPWASAAQAPQTVNRDVGKPPSGAQVRTSVESQNWFRRIWEKAGCMLDPFGGTCSSGHAVTTLPGATTSPTAKGAGCMIDPFGSACTPVRKSSPIGTGAKSAQGSRGAGCTLDPLGCFAER